MGPGVGLHAKSNISHVVRASSLVTTPTALPQFLLLALAIVLEHLTCRTLHRAHNAGTDRQINQRSQVYLQCYDPGVVYLGHVAVCQGVAGVVTDLKPRVEFKHVQQLQTKQTNRPYSSTHLRWVCTTAGRAVLTATPIYRELKFNVL